MYVRVVNQRCVASVSHVAVKGDFSFAFGTLLYSTYGVIAGWMYSADRYIRRQNNQELPRRQEELYIGNDNELDRSLCGGNVGPVFVCLPCERRNTRRDETTN